MIFQFLSIFLCFFAFCFGGAPLNEPAFLRENNIAFPTNHQIQSKEGIQFYGILLDEDFNCLYKSGDGSFSFEEDALPLDIHNYWAKRGDENYKTFLTKVAYSVNREASYFSEKQLTDIQFIRKTLPDYEVDQLSPGKYAVDCGYFGPSFNYDLSFYRAPYQQPEIRSLVAYAAQQNPELGKPALVSLHHNYNYGKVMMHRTSKMSVSLTCYFPYHQSKTLVVNYTLNYIYELPPKFLGGYELLIDKVKEGISDLVIQTRKVSSQV